MPLLTFNSLQINGHYVIIDVFHSKKYNSLVMICNNRSYIKNNLNFDILSMKVSYNLPIEFLTVESGEYIEIEPEFSDIKDFFYDRYHHEICLLKNCPEEIDNITVSLDNTNYEIKVDPIDLRFINKKCLTTIQANEILLIESWIEWHKKLGFEYFFIYDNNFKEELYDVLFIKYPTELFVYNADFEYYYESYGKHRVGQCIQQSHTIWKFTPEFLGLTDLDEYINPVNGFSIFNQDISVLSLPNYWFGCNNSAKFSPKNFTKILTKRNTEGSLKSNRKCIIKSLDVDLVCVHIALNYRGKYIRVKYNEAYLRHYIILSFQKRKCDCQIYCQTTDSVLLS
jgi:hypothetical protein